MWNTTKSCGFQEPGGNERALDKAGTTLRIPAVREVFCLVILIVVIMFGWNQPYSEHFRSLTGAEAEPTPPPATPKPQPTGGTGSTLPRNLGANVAQPTPDRSWMFEKTSMDAPQSDSKKGGRGGR